MSLSFQVLKTRTLQMLKFKRQVKRKTWSSINFFINIHSGNFSISDTKKDIDFENIIMLNNWKNNILKFKQTLKIEFFRFNYNKGTRFVDKTHNF